MRCTIEVQDKLIRGGSVWCRPESENSSKFAWKEFNLESHDITLHMIFYWEWELTKPILSDEDVQLVRYISTEDLKSIHEERMQLVALSPVKRDFRANKVLITIPREGEIDG